MTSPRRIWGKTLATAGLLALMAGPVAANNSSHLDTPLLVVRFNQERVYYQQPLYNAVSRAVEAKPSVFFNIVAVVPQSGNASADRNAEKETQARAAVLLGDMVKMGVPQSRLHLSYQKSQAPSPEIHIFVE